LQQYDIKTAFLCAPIGEEEVYVRPPSEFYDQDVYDRTGARIPRSRIVWKLKKALYGLKSAPNAFYRHISKVLRSLGWKRSDVEPALFFIPGSNVMLLIYVDDMLFFGHRADVQKHLDKILSIFTVEACPPEVKGKDKVFQFVGIEIYQRAGNRYAIRQDKLVEKILRDFKPIRMSSRRQDGKQKTVPCTNQDIDRWIEQVTDGTLKQTSNVCRENYRKLIGCLLYLVAGVRFDIAYAVGWLSRYLENNTAVQYNVANSVLQYLEDNKGFEVPMAPGKIRVEGFSDSDWAQCKETRRSVSGGCVLIGKSLVFWRSKKQQSVALSSTEAEYVGLSEISREVIYFAHLIREIGVNLPEVRKEISDKPRIGSSKTSGNREFLEKKDGEFTFTPCLRGDNRSSIILAKTLEVRRLKHIDIRFHHIRDLLERRKLQCEYVSTILNKADIYTKFLSTAVFQNQVDLILNQGRMSNELLEKGRIQTRKGVIDSIEKTLDDDEKVLFAEFLSTGRDMHLTTRYRNNDSSWRHKHDRLDNAHNLSELCFFGLDDINNITRTRRVVKYKVEHENEGRFAMKPTHLHILNK